MEYLVRVGELSAQEAVRLMKVSGGAEREVVKMVGVGGWPGIMVWQTRVISGGDARQQLMWKKVLACAVMGGGDLILLKLEGEGVVSAGDEDLVGRVAGSIAVRDRPAPRAAEEVELGQGIFVRVPKGLLAVAENDGLRSGRRMVGAEVGEWVGVDLAPCVFFPAVNEQGLAGMMMVRDAKFHAKEVKKIDEGTWVCERDSKGIFGGVALLRCAKDGRAVLGEIRWDRFGQSAGAMEKRVEEVKSALVEGVRFGGEVDLMGLVNRGVAARKTLVGSREAVGDTEEVWEWLDELSSHSSVRKASFREDGTGLSGSGSTRGGLRMLGFEKEFFSWRLAKDWGSYDFELTRAGLAGSLSQSFKVQEGKFEGEGVEGGEGIVRTSGDLAGNFVPGGVWPLVMGKLPFEPMILSTESVVGMSGFSAGLILVRVEPAFDMPRTGSDGEAMRCFSVEVNGSGRSSRWYVDERGKVAEVVFAGKVVMKRSQ